MNQNIAFETGNKKLTEMVLWEDNPRTITKDEFEKLKRSIERKPYYMNARPIVMSDRTGKNIIIAGNQRYKAVLALGWKEAPAIIFHCETEEQEVEIAMIDNHNNGEWDMEAIANKFLDYPLAEWLGSDWDKMAGDIVKVDPDDLDEVPPEDLPEETDAKPGDLYELGDHRLIVGDSTDPKVLETLLGGEKADLIVTDPPYNINVSNSQGMTIQNDNMAKDEFQKFCNEFSKAMIDNLKDGGAFYVWHASKTQREFENALNNAGVEVRQQLIWVKNTFTLGRSDYQWRHEVCFYGFKGGAGHWFVDDRTQSTVTEDKPLEEMTDKEARAILEKIYELPSTILREDKPLKNDSHPDMKPVKLFGRLIKNSSKERERVLDPFAGSGTTLIACEQLGRKAYLCELDPKYAQVILDRYYQLTGERAKKLN